LIACASGGLAQATSTLIINELDVSQSNNNINEFVELKNIGTTTINTKGWVIAQYSWNPTRSAMVLFDQQTLIDYDVAPGGYFVLCIFPVRTLLCTQELKMRSDGNVIDANWLGNTNSSVVIYSPQSMVANDTVGYGSSTPPLAQEFYLGSGAAPADSVNYIGTSISRWPDGVNTLDNAVDFIHTCRTPGKTNAAPIAADNRDTALAACAAEVENSDIAINEIDYAQDGGDTREFIEFHNRKDVPINVALTTTWRFRINDANNVTVLNVTISGRTVPLVIPIHGYFTVCAAGSGVCSGAGARPIGVSNITNGFLPSAVDWLPNPNATSPYYTIELLKFGSGSSASIMDTLTYGGGVGVGDIDRPAEALFGVSRYPDSLNTDNNRNDFSARYASSSSSFLLSRSDRMATHSLTYDAPVQVYYPQSGEHGCVRELRSQQLAFPVTNQVADQLADQLALQLADQLADPVAHAHANPVIN
jgi:hypothetical protein